MKILGFTAAAGCGCAGVGTVTDAIAKGDANLFHIAIILFGLAGIALVCSVCRQAESEGRNAARTH